MHTQNSYTFRLHAHALIRPCIPSCAALHRNARAPHFFPACTTSQSLASTPVQCACCAHAQCTCMPACALRERSRTCCSAARGSVARCTRPRPHTARDHVPRTLPHPGSLTPTREDCPRAFAPRKPASPALVDGVALQQLSCSQLHLRGRGEVPGSVGVEKFPGRSDGPCTLAPLLFLPFLSSPSSPLLLLFFSLVRGRG